MFHVKQLQAERLAEYRQLVQRYHRALDLMSPRAVSSLGAKIDDARAYARALDALVPPAGAVLDLGSGVGLPGVVLAILCPERPVFLVERRRRRAGFLRIAVSQLGLENAVVCEQDVRQVELDGVPAVCAQAVAGFDELYCLTRRLHAAEVVLLSRKGPDWRREVARLERLLGGAVSPAYQEALEAHGTLIGLRVPGGLACPSLA